MSTKTLGVVGGMGPQASADFYELLIKNTVAEKDQDHLDVVIYSHASIPDRTESIKNNSTEKVVEKLVEDVKKLHKFGADYIVLTCNTSHLFVEELQKNIPVPIISIIDVTVDYLKSIKIKKVGLMATDGTIKEKIYTNKLIENGIEVIIPNVDNQKLVMEIIYGQIKKGKEVNDSMFQKVVAEQKNQGAGAIILGCTELSYYGDIKGLEDFYVNPQKILARKCISLCGGMLTEEL